MKNINRDIVNKYLEGTCSKEEQIQVEEWLDAIQSWAFDTDSAITNEDPSEKIWAGIANRIDVKSTRNPASIRYAKYVAAAIVLFFVTFSMDRTILPEFTTGSHGLTVVQISSNVTRHTPYGQVDFFKISNETTQPVKLQRKSTGRVYTLQQQEACIAVYLDADPGVMGERVLLLTAEDIHMLPDIALANQLAQSVNREELIETPTFNVL